MSDAPSPARRDPQSPEEVYDQVHDLFRKLLSEANYILKAGTTQNKIALMRSVIPALMKELQAREESARDAETREMLKDLFAAARFEIKEKPDGDT